MEPTPKNPNIDMAIYVVTGVDRAEMIQNDLCAFKCDKPNFKFRNELSRKEYCQSGLCQRCQDKFFGKD